jgi:N-6 DNA Methylase
MNLGIHHEWREQFGIGDADAKLFFASKSDLGRRDTTGAQGHVLRRAFDLLDLDGVFCTDNTPLVYFKRVDRIHLPDVARLHQKFWNHGGAPILVLISRDDVHVYSGLVRPAPQGDATQIPGFVQAMSRTSSALREFLPAVESGEFFRSHPRSFNPAHRVDRDLLDNLEATRQKLLATSTGGLDPRALDALLCRLVFACYLFDREVIGQSYLDAIGLRDAMHLRDVLGIHPRSKAKDYLYALFQKLDDDFNGDLFGTDLAAEAGIVSSSWISTLNEFFRATDAVTGQRSFWPYDFSAIPVEVVSAIYERFLQASEKRGGSFYTPRFLAEVVLDVALASTSSLLGRRYLDPACGSGIFLVGIFNRMAEEWRRSNPAVRNDRRARELRKILCNNLFGIDVNLTACRITAFSLYLAYLDQLSPRDIQDLQQQGHKLPRLVHGDGQDSAGAVEGNIWCGDFFAECAEYPRNVDLVIGNPPWGSTATDGTPAATWCAHPDRLYPVPDKQIATAFIWKATHHVSDSGRICLVLPHGTIFNHSTTALDFQRNFFKRHAVEVILNLVDYQFFLFAEARHPAIVVTYRKDAPAAAHHTIQYWAPKADWLIMRGEIIAIAPDDRSRVDLREVLDDLEGKDAPQIWKQRYWATSRDRRLINRLALYPRLRDHVRQLRQMAPHKRWLMAVGVQPVRDGDDPARAKTIRLPSRLFVEAKGPARLSLFLLPSDCTKLTVPEFTVRSGSNTDTAVFKAPHVLVAKGFSSVVFADFDVSFQDFLRGIHGPAADRELLVFLAAYLNSRLAKYFLFHTSSNWGVTRQQIHVDELLRLPFMMPDELPHQRRAREIVSEVADIVAKAATAADDYFANRVELVNLANAAIEPLLNEYFDVVPLEHALIEDTLRVIIPSFRPTRSRRVVPTIEPSRQAQRDEYTQRVCDTLNSWSKSGLYVVEGRAVASATLGIGIAVLQKMAVGRAGFDASEDFGDLLSALERLRSAASQRLNTFELFRGAKVFDHDRLYVVKPIGQRFWTQTAALNDADEISGTILMHSPQEIA